MGRGGRHAPSESPIERRICALRSWPQRQRRACRVRHRQPRACRVRWGCPAAQRTRRTRPCPRAESFEPRRSVPALISTPFTYTCYLHFVPTPLTLTFTFDLAYAI